MANQGAKKRFEENRKRLAALRLALAAGLVTYVVMRLLVRRGYSSFWHLAGLAFTAVVEAFTYTMIAKFAEPAYSDSGELIYGGADLSMAGMCSYYHDVLYVSVFVQVASCLSSYFWYVYLVVPGYGGWLLWKNVLGPYLAASKGGKEETVDEATRKKLERTQLRAERRKNKWR